MKSVGSREYLLQTVSKGEQTYGSIAKGSAGSGVANDYSTTKVSSGVANDTKWATKASIPVSLENNNFSIHTNQNQSKYQNLNDISAIAGINISEQVAENESFMLIEGRF